MVALLARPLLTKPRRGRKRWRCRARPGVGDVANDNVSVGIQNNNVRAARDVDAAGVAVHGQVVPASLTPMECLDNVIARRSREGVAAPEKKAAKKMMASESEPAIARKMNAYA